MAGESDNYYADPEANKGYPPPNQPYGQQQYGQYQQNQQNFQQQQQQQQQPPQYNQQYQSGPNPNAFNNNEKPTFEQAFRIEKPKLNDWWAGILLLAVFAGFVAVSGISLQGYGMFDFEGKIGLASRDGLTRHTQPRPRASMEEAYTVAEMTSGSTPTRLSCSSSASPSRSC